MTPYEEWLKEHHSKSGSYDQIVKLCLENIARKGGLHKLPLYFPVKREKGDS